MEKDTRYNTVGHLIKDGRITCFREIFIILPKSIMAADLGMNNSRFERMKNNVVLFRINDSLRMAALLEVTEMEIAGLIYNQHLADKEEKEKRI